MNINNQSDTIEGYVLVLQSSEETAFEALCDEFIKNYYTNELVVIDLRNRRVTERKSALLFGRLLVEEQCSEVYVEHLRAKDIPDICHGIDAVFEKRYPDGITTAEGKVINYPEIAITLPAEGHRLTRIELDVETVTTMLIMDKGLKTKDYDNRRDKKQSCYIH